MKYLHGAHVNELLSNTRKSLQLMSKLINSKCKSTKTAKKQTTNGNRSLTLVFSFEIQAKTTCRPCFFDHYKFSSVEVLSSMKTFCLKLLIEVKNKFQSFGVG